MAVVTFWSECKKEIGQTSTAIAVATQMAIEHNYKILLLSTSNDKELELAFWEAQKQKKGLGAIFEGTQKVNIDSGMQGLAKAVASNKITPDIITNYTKIVFKDRLEIIDGYGGEEYNNIFEFYEGVIRNANSYYDIVMVDLNRDINNETVANILNMSDVVIYGINQNKSSLDLCINSVSQGFLANRKNVVLYLGRYDRFSKYNSKNIARYLRTGRDMNHLSYNTLFSETCYEGAIADLFLKLKTIKTEDKNLELLTETRELSESIIYKIQELNLKI